MRAKHSAPYVAGLAGPALAVVSFVTDQALPQIAWWTDIPWFLIWLISGAFLVGVASQDVLNPESWLRQWWIKKSELFHVSSVWTERSHDRPYFHKGCAGLTFSRDADVVEVCLIKYRIHGEQRGTRAAKMKFLGVSRGETRYLTLAETAFDAEQGPGARVAGSDVGIPDGEPVWIAIEARIGRRRQRYVVQIIHAAARPTNRIIAVAADWDMTTAAGRT